MVKVVVKAMEEAGGLTGAIRVPYDQSWVPEGNEGGTTTGEGTHLVDDKGRLCERLERSIAFRVSIGLE